MKRLIPILLLLTLLLSGCSSVSLSAGSEGTVTYIYKDISFTEALTEEEVRSVVKVLDGKSIDNSMLMGAPACGVNSNVAITIGGRKFLLACDNCGTVRDMRTLGYIYISDAERAILEKIFTSRGGKFPCI